MNNIFATVEGGVVAVEEVPDSAQVFVRDYDLPLIADDNDEVSITEDEHGDQYVQTSFGNGKDTVIISVNGGVVEVDELPDKYTVTIHDYDVDDGVLEEDSNGARYSVRVFEN